MNLWQTKVIAIFRPLIALMLVLILTSCGEKAVSQEPSLSLPQPQQTQISKQISEVSPPTAVQELRQTLEGYQPQVAILTPKPNEILQDNTVKVRLLVKDLPIFKDPQLNVGPHLQVILDNEPVISVYDLNQPLTLPELSPGSHTLRVFATYPWDESFKNEGAYAQTRFHIFTQTDDNNPNPAKPLLTYNTPQGKYGTQPVLLDFYLTNAPLHLVAQDNPKDEISDWHIRCTINDESFVIDRWQPLYLKGLKPGKNWVKLEFLDEQGKPVKNVFNTTVKVVTYEPLGEDTLSKIFRGEVSAERVRAIVDPNYNAKVPVSEPTPTPPIEKPIQKEPIKPLPEETPQIEQTKSKQPIESPSPKPEPEITPSPEATTLPEKVPPQQEKSKLGEFSKLNTNKVPTPEITPEPSPSLPPTLPEIVIESPSPEATAKPEPAPTPTPKSNTLPEKTLPSPVLPEVIESPVPEVTPSKTN
ncbi:hypothetical protein G7B40_000855 [Aetokthonos hydrillicola Thurmond2011]|jgi:hypothetical protein|uniref:FHA domain containing protein n=1 Tax=Aetokthonos hydrillicola Thurmond2011 TaxID=2712845 RepID=A0AAP5M8C2_9CYAN|nr:hypothetical protein [Aetokthonos hydrillicola]MBO3463730.1 hypothetical protein [Aetokthonos hydrillicola CCALA 1050]MBW4588182.1 hypothetical protein [Aetokthonos hydrillicola CCALA 1050]MDR9893134.1 hypothetical protein [Aetokthonos hydrillicola Thurmond2011]